MPKTADLSLIDPKITTISLVDKKLVIKDKDKYTNALDSARIPEE
jgi:hypothetical protein